VELHEPRENTSIEITLKDHKMTMNRLHEIGGKKRGRGRKVGMDKTFAPEKYHMVVCPCCSGSGRFVNPPDGMKEVCPKCGGFGHLKKETY
jgi:DnaJ-class molecular chaperone